MTKVFTYDSRKYQYTGKAFSGMISSPDSAGGELVPTPLADFFIDVIAKNQWGRQLFRTINVPGKTLEIPIKTAGDTVYLGGEGLNMDTEGGASQSGSSFTRPTWSSMTLTPSKLNGLSGYTTELDEDSSFAIADITMRELLRAIAEAEENAFIQGDSDGTIKTYTSGQVNKAWNGLIHQIPGSNAGTGANWTPSDASPENWIDAGSAVLTSAMLDELLVKVEEQRGVCNTIFVSPTVAGRLRNKTEFEMLQGIKDVGASQAALVRGFVGRYYTADIFVSNDLPVGDTDFVTNSDDTIVIGLDRIAPVIGDRRQITIRQRYKFYEDVIEMQFTERVDFNTYYNQLQAGLADVKSAVA